MYKKLILSLGVMGTFAAYSFYIKSDNNTISPPIVALNTPLPTNPPQEETTPVPGTTIIATPTPVVQPTQRGQYKDGAYTGPVADAFYGSLQVKVIISGGKITDVQFLQYPSDRRTSIEINQQAMPYLKQEAIAIQSARVDGVSGATQTSKAFIESLRSALNQAI